MEAAPAPAPGAAPDLAAQGSQPSQLWIVTLADRLRILLDHHVGINAVVLNLPLSFGREIAEAG